MIQSITKGIHIDSFFSFWFSNPGSASFLEIALWSGAFLFLVVCGVVVFVYSKTILKGYPPKQKLLGSIFWVFVSFGLSGILFVPLRYLSPNFIGIRFIPALVWFLGFAWAIYLIYRYLKKSPSETLKFETRALKERYFKKSK
jgi:hypothetical protein